MFIFIYIYIPKSFSLWTVYPCFYTVGLNEEENKYLNSKIIQARKNLNSLSIWKRKKNTACIFKGTLCPRSLDQLHIGRYLVKTSWTYSEYGM